jgi:hypothetical protein
MSRLMFKAELQGAFLLLNMQLHYLSAYFLYSLFSGSRHGLWLTSETYIEVSSISHANFTEQSVISSPKSNWLKDGSLSTASPCLFFHQKYFTDSRPMQFHCRVGCFLLKVHSTCYIWIIQGPVGQTLRRILWLLAQFYLLLYSFWISHLISSFFQIATVLVLVLNKSTNHGETPNVKVRLAGFILGKICSIFFFCLSYRIVYIIPKFEIVPMIHRDVLQF